MPRIPLSPRQREVLRLAALGLGNREIGHRLGCSQHTVKGHMSDALQRLGVSSRTEAWRELGWLKPRRTD